MFHELEDRQKLDALQVCPLLQVWMDCLSLVKRMFQLGCQIAQILVTEFVLQCVKGVSKDFQQVCQFLELGRRKMADLHQYLAFRAGKCQFRTNYQKYLDLQFLHQFQGDFHLEETIYGCGQP